jgi:hypothetical protein
MRFRLILLLSVILLSACAPPLKTEIEQNDKGIILYASEIKPDFETGFMRATPRLIFTLWLETRDLDNERHGGNYKIWPTAQSDLFWVAVAVKPGTYQLLSVQERRSGIVRIDTKATVLDKTKNRFAVGAGEVIFLGRFVANIETSPQLLNRYTEDATKSYSLDTEEARLALGAHFNVDKFMLKTFDPFNADPDLRARYETPFKDRPFVF